MPTIILYWQVYQLQSLPLIGLSTMMKVALQIHLHGHIIVMAVAGGLLAVGGGVAAELYDEGSGRWVMLPHAVVQPRGAAGLISVPAGALGASAAAAAASH